MISSTQTESVVDHRVHPAIWGVVVVMLLGACGCGRETARPSADSSGPGTAQLAESTQGNTAMKFNLISSAFKAGAAIPRKHTGEGDDVSPPLAWDGAPDGTKEYALICDDPDAPTPQPWVHWVIYGIPAEVRALPEGVKSNEPELKEPIVARQGKNSFPSGPTTGYRGPLPPPGHGTHHYQFKLYALDKRLDLPPASAKEQLLDSMKGHVLAEGELVGTYERNR